MLFVFVPGKFNQRCSPSVVKEFERESYVIATKVRAEVATFHNGGGLSRKHISWQIRESLSRLKTYDKDRKNAYPEWDGKVSTEIKP